MEREDTENEEFVVKKTTKRKRLKVKTSTRESNDEEAPEPETTVEGKPSKSITSSDMKKGDRDHLLEIAPFVEVVSLTEPWVGRLPTVERLLQRLNPEILRSLSLNSASHPKDIEKFLTSAEFPNLEELLLGAGEHVFFQENYQFLRTISLPKLRVLRLINLFRWAEKPGEALKNAFPVLRPVLERFKSTLEVVEFQIPGDPFFLLKLIMDDPKLVKKDLESICQEQIGVSARVLGISSETLAKKDLLSFVVDRIQAQMKSGDVEVDVSSLQQFLLPEAESDTLFELASMIMASKCFSARLISFEGAPEGYLSVLGWCRSIVSPSSDNAAPIWYRGYDWLVYHQTAIPVGSKFNSELRKWRNLLWISIETDAVSTLQSMQKAMSVSLTGMLDLLTEDTDWAGKHLPLNRRIKSSSGEEEPLWHYLIARDFDSIRFMKILQLPGFDPSLTCSSGETLLKRMVALQSTAALGHWADAMIRSGIEISEADKQAIKSLLSGEERLERMLSSSLEYFASLITKLDIQPALNVPAIQKSIKLMFEYYDDYSYILKSVAHLALLFPDFKFPTTQDEMKQIEGFDELQLGYEHASSLSNEQLTVAFARIEKARMVPGLLEEWISDVRSLGVKLTEKGEPDYSAPVSKQQPMPGGKAPRDKDKKCRVM